MNENAEGYKNQYFYFLIMNNLEIKKIMQFTVAVKSKILRNKGNKNV